MKVIFSERLKELRLEKSLTQEGLAKIFHLHSTTVTCWEKKGKEPSFQTLADLAEFFEVSVGYLLGTES